MSTWPCTHEGGFVCIKVRLGADDILIVSELSRIGRSMLDCMEILAIAAKREIRVYAIKGNCHLDETIQSRIMAMVFSMAAEIEWGLISARTKETLRARRASGLPVGRPKGPGKSKLDKHRPEIEALLANGPRNSSRCVYWGSLREPNGIPNDDQTKRKSPIGEDRVAKLALTRRKQRQYV